MKLRPQGITTISVAVIQQPVDKYSILMVHMPTREGISWFFPHSTEDWEECNLSSEFLSQNLGIEPKTSIFLERVIVASGNNRLEIVPLVVTKWGGALESLNPRMIKDIVYKSLRREPEYDVPWYHNKLVSHLLEHLPK